MRGLSARPHFPGFRERFKLRAAALAAYPMYRGVAQLAGMEVLPVGETPLDAFAAAKQAWNEHDFFFIHVKGTDQAGEDGDFDAKVATIEAVDQALPALLALQPDVLCVTGDHSTPVPVKQHSWHPVPTLVVRPAVRGGPGAALPRARRADREPRRAREQGPDGGAAGQRRPPRQVRSVTVRTFLTCCVVVLLGAASVSRAETPAPLDLARFLRLPRRAPRPGLGRLGGARPGRPLGRRRALRQPGRLPGARRPGWRRCCSA